MKPDIVIDTVLKLSSSLVFSVAILAMATGLASAEELEIEGYWATSNLTSVVEVQGCGDSLCAEIAWLWDVAVRGRKMLDDNNAASSKQKMPLVGLQLFSRFRREGDQWLGRIYNPEDGRTYKATVTLRSKNILRIKGCWGPFCLTRHWRRLGSIALPTESDLNTRKR